MAVWAEAAAAQVEVEAVAVAAAAEVQAEAAQELHAVVLPACQKMKYAG